MFAKKTTSRLRTERADRFSLITAGPVGRLCGAVRVNGEKPDPLATHVSEDEGITENDHSVSNTDTDERQRRALENKMRGQGGPEGS